MDTYIVCLGRKSDNEVPNNSYKTHLASALLGEKITSEKHPHVAIFMRSFWNPFKIEGWMSCCVQSSDQPASWKSYDPKEMLGIMC